MDLDIHSIIGEYSTIEKKERLERNKPKSWLKSVSAFANGEGGILLYGISDDGELLGLTDAEHDAEFISEAIKAKLDPIPEIDLQIKEVDGANFIVLDVKGGQETPYYYIGDKQRLAFIRVGNQSVVADRIQLKQLVLKGSNQTYDSLLSPYRMEDMYVNYSNSKGGMSEDTRFVKEPQVFAKEFVKARRQIYSLISQNPRVTTAQMSEIMGLSTRQIQKYLKRLTELNLISREGGRKTGNWIIIDKDYEGILGKI